MMFLRQARLISVKPSVRLSKQQNSVASVLRYNGIRCIFASHAVRQAGFTLLELMITVAIVGILSALAFPSFKSTITSNRLTTATNQMVTALNLARSEAVKRGQYVVVRRTDTTWEKGWQVFVDLERGSNTKDNIYNANTDDLTLRSFSALSDSITLRGSTDFADFVTYTPTGQTHAEGRLVICDSDAISGAKLIVVNTIGRVRIGTDADHDGVPGNDDNTEITSCTSNL